MTESDYSEASPLMDNDYRDLFDSYDKRSCCRRWWDTLVDCLCCWCRY